MANKPYEQEVLLGVDGKPLFNAMDILEKRIGNIAKMLKNIEESGLATVKKVNTTVDANLKALQKAQGQQRTLANLGSTDRTVQRTLARNTAQSDAGRFGTNTTKIGYELELEKKLQALRAAGSEKEKIAALQSVQTAQARLRAIQQIEAAETRAAAAQRGSSRTDNLSEHRARLALSRQYAESQAKIAGTDAAITAQKSRQVAAEQALSRANFATRDGLRQNLELENSRLRAIERVAAAEKRVAVAAKGNAPVGVGIGAGPEKPSRLANILTPGYAAAAFARTSVYGAAAGAAYGAFSAVSGSISNVVALQDELARLQSISNSTDTQMQSLKASIFEVGRTSRFSLIDLVNISKTLAQAGIASGEMSTVLKSVTTLATASGSTPDEAVQLLTSALGAFQLQSSEAARVADLMTTALNRTKLTVQQTGQAIQYVGATAFEQNIGLEQLLATVGAVAQAGVKSGSTIGTGFRQFLVDLADPSKNLQEQLTLLGLSAADVDVKTRGLPQVLENLTKAGFGSAQAYAGLEVRAAAFYLVVKNNAELIDQLQLSFANSGAAALANERAMNTLTAQWQRFKNILSEGFSNSMQETMQLLQNLLEKASSTILSIKERTDKQPLFDPNAGKDLMNFLNAVTPVMKENFGVGLGTWINDLSKRTDGMTAASQRMATQVAKTSETVDAQKGKIVELDKEMMRLITQKESLRNHDTRSAAEIATLTSRFQGLAVHLTGVGNRYDDLTQAMKRYRVEQLRLLGIELTAQNSSMTAQSGDARLNSRNAISQLRGNSGLFSQLNSAEQAAVTTMQNAAPNSRQGAKAIGILGSAVARFGNEDPKDGPYNQQIVTLLNSIVQSGQLVATNTATTASNLQLIGAANAGQTDFAQQVTDAKRDISGLIDNIKPLTNDSADKKKLTSQALGGLNILEKGIKQRLLLVLAPESRKFLEDELSELPQLRVQIKALNTATKDETSAAAKAEREANKAERGPVLTQAKMDAIAQAFLGPGWSQGRGQVSKESQNRLHALGVTKATGDTSQHSNGGIARDWRAPAGMSGAKMENTLKALDQHFANMGVDVYVRYETGKGRNQGTGRHGHVSARKGTRFKGAAAGDASIAEGKFEDDTDAAQTVLDRRDLNEALKELGKASTAAGRDAALAKAKAAMQRVNDGLKKEFDNDIAKGGIREGSPQYNARLAQLKEAIIQNVDEMQARLADSIVKNAAAMIKSATEAFEAALKPSQRAVGIAEGALNGLGYASMQGRVPDYTRQLAEQQAARTREAADRARLTNMPQLIGATETVLNGLVSQRDSGVLDQAGLDTVNLKILELTNNLEGLKTTRDGLAAAFGAEGLLPKTLSEGLSQAIEAYRALNGLNLTFTEQLNNQMSGAIGTVHQGLEAMFGSILDGSATAGQAIGNFAKAMLQAISQIVAKMIATQIITMLLNLVGSVVGAKASGSSSGSGAALWGSVDGAFTGGPVGRMQGGPLGYAGGGGAIMNGSSSRDSVFAKLAKGEWVINKRAVDSVGHEFMADLNARGANAVKQTQSMPSLEVKPVQKVNVWMVKPDEKPSMGPNDVLVTWTNDVLSNGQSRKLIQAIARESK